MLKGIPSIINADLLWVLRAMGHGDDLAVVDRNFPARTVASHTTSGKLICMDGCNDTQAVAAILTLFPIDTFVPVPIHHMQVVDQPEAQLDVHTEVLSVCRREHGGELAMGSIERHDFYTRAKQCFAVVQTSEDRPYGCFILKKGVVF